MLSAKKVLFPTDFSECAGRALPEALRWARELGAELHLLNVLVLHDNDPFVPGKGFPDTAGIAAAANDYGRDELRRLAASVEGGSVPIQTATLRGVSAAPTIVDYVREHAVDLVVMATHSSRARHFFLGSVTRDVVRHAPCPVLTVNGKQESGQVGPIRRILVPVDFSNHSSQALALAAELANRHGAVVDLLHVVQETSPVFYEALGSAPAEVGGAQPLGEARLEVERLAESSQVETALELHVLRGAPSAEIANFAKTQKPDLVVMATHGLTGLAHLMLGSVCEKVLGQAPCPVLAVKTAPAAEDVKDGRANVA